MTDTTRSLIERCSSQFDWSSFVNVFLRLQEEDDLQDIVAGKGVYVKFRVLRNFAAHNPDALIKSFKEASGLGDIVFTIADDTECIEINMEKTITGLLIAAIERKDILYVQVAKIFLYAIYGDKIKQDAVSLSKLDLSGEFRFIKDYQERRWEKKGTFKTFSLSNQYLIDTIKSQVGRGFRMIFPNYMQVLVDCIIGTPRVDLNIISMVVRIALRRDEK